MKPLSEQRPSGRSQKPPGIVSNGRIPLFLQHMSIRRRRGLLCKRWNGPSDADEFMWCVVRLVSVLTNWVYRRGFVFRFGSCRSAAENLSFEACAKWCQMWYHKMALRVRRIGWCRHICFEVFNGEGSDNRYPDHDIWVKQNIFIKFPTMCHRGTWIWTFSVCGRLQP